jgi:hypothetical protein
VLTVDQAPFQLIERPLRGPEPSLNQPTAMRVCHGDGCALLPGASDSRQAVLDRRRDSPPHPLGVLGVELCGAGDRITRARTASSISVRRAAIRRATCVCGSTADVERSLSALRPPGPRSSLPAIGAHLRPFPQSGFITGLLFASLPL